MKDVKGSEAGRRDHAKARPTVRAGMQAAEQQGDDNRAAPGGDAGDVFPDDAGAAGVGPGGARRWWCRMPLNGPLRPPKLL